MNKFILYDKNENIIEQIVTNVTVEGGNLTVHYEKVEDLYVKIKLRWWERLLKWIKFYIRKG